MERSNKLEVGKDRKGEMPEACGLGRQCCRRGHSATIALEKDQGVDV